MSGTEFFSRAPGNHYVCTLSIIQNYTPPLLTIMYTISLVLSPATPPLNSGECLSTVANMLWRGDVSFRNAGILIGLQIAQSTAYLLRGWCINKCPSALIDICVLFPLITGDFMVPPPSVWNPDMYMCLQSRFHTAAQIYFNFKLCGPHWS